MIIIQISIRGKDQQRKSIHLCTTEECWVLMNLLRLYGCDDTAGKLLKIGGGNSLHIKTKHPRKRICQQGYYGHLRRNVNAHHQTSCMLAHQHPCSFVKYVKNRVLQHHFTKGIKSETERWKGWVKYRIWFYRKIKYKDQEALDIKSKCFT